MKNYVITIIACSVLLMLFPFLGLSEFWEYLYVVIPAFVIAYCGLWIARNINNLTEGTGSDSLQEYIETLQKRFKQVKKKYEKEGQATDITKSVDSVTTNTLEEE